MVFWEDMVIVCPVAARFGIAGVRYCISTANADISGRQCAISNTPWPVAAKYDGDPAPNVRSRTFAAMQSPPTQQQIVSV